MASETRDWGARLSALQMAESLVAELNEFRQNIPGSCERLFEQVKASYNVQQLSFGSIGGGLALEDTRLKFGLNAYLRERVLGDCYLPGLEFDPHQNAAFIEACGRALYEAAEAPDSRPQLLAAAEQAAASSLLAVYCAKHLRLADESAWRDLVSLFLCEEYFRKACPEISQDSYASTFLFRGEHPRQKPVSFFDGRYISCYCYLDFGPLGEVRGVLLALVDVSVLAKEHFRQAAVTRANKQLTRSEDQEREYLGRVKKYHGLYQAAPRFDEKVLMRVFHQMDFDNDGRVGKQDLWRHCQEKKIDIQREATDRLIEACNQHSLGAQPYKLRWSKNDPITLNDFYAAVNYQLRVRPGQQLQETYRAGAEVWAYILDASGVSRDPEHQRLAFKEPRPTHLQFIDPNNVTRNIRNARLKKSQTLVRLVSTKDAAQHSQRSLATGPLPKPQDPEPRRLLSNNSELQTGRRPDVYPERRPEAFVVVNDTIALREANNRGPSALPEEAPALKKVNQGLTEEFDATKTTNFYSQELFNEHERISLHPREVLESSTHPLFRYVPVNQRDPDLYDDRTRSQNQTVPPELPKIEQPGAEPSVSRGFHPIKTGTNRFLGTTMSSFHDTKKGQRTAGGSTAAGSLTRTKSVAPAPGQRQTFATNFRQDQGADMRKHESRVEREHRESLGVDNKFVPPSAYQFRADEQPFGKRPFITNRKTQAPTDPGSLADRRPRETIERERLQAQKQEERAERERKAALGLKVRDRDQWVNYIKLPDKYHRMGDKQQIGFLQKEPFDEEVKYNSDYHTSDYFTEKPSFKLFFRQLNTSDKDKFMGYSFTEQDAPVPRPKTFHGGRLY